MQGAALGFSRLPPEPVVLDSVVLGSKRKKRRVSVVTPQREGVHEILSENDYLVCSGNKRGNPRLRQLPSVAAAVLLEAVDLSGRKRTVSVDFPIGMCFLSKARVTYSQTLIDCKLLSCCWYVLCSLSFYEHPQASPQ